MYIYNPVLIAILYTYKMSALRFMKKFAAYCQCFMLFTLPLTLKHFTLFDYFTTNILTPMKYIFFKYLLLIFIYICRNIFSYILCFHCLKSVKLFIKTFDKIF